MDIGRAFSYSFDDKDWVNKLVITAIVAFAGVVLLPFFLIGLVPLAALLGYTVELVRNLREGQPTPLPRWDNYGNKIQQGGNVLAAGLVYNIPNLLVVCCIATLGSALGDDSAVGGLMGLVFCCLLPFLLIYNITVNAMMGLGLARYSEEGNIGVFFQFGDLLSALMGNISVTGNWVILSIVASFLLNLLGLIPCVGWLATIALTIPVQGFLLAQFANLLESKPKGKPKRSF